MKDNAVSVACPLDKPYSIHYSTSIVLVGVRGARKRGESISYSHRSYAIQKTIKTTPDCDQMQQASDNEVLT
uniref:Uncharacterized protein n=1 Tax=Hyaloperonospora arabidopsidis (strain Emoy2) TaxID=559515 RepID=M4C0M5_HYAAE